MTTSLLPLSGFWRGVSQQAPSERPVGLASLQENAFGSLVDGLYPRPNTEHLATLTDSNAGPDSFRARIDHANAQFFVFITGDATEPLEVYTLQGVKQAVRYGRWYGDNLWFESAVYAKPYLAAGTLAPVHRFSLLTMIDRAYIVNNEVTVTTDPNPSINLDGTVQKFTDLPIDPGPNDFYFYKISGSESNNYTSFYVQSDKSLGKFFWTEIPKPSELDQPTFSTMPHMLKRLPDGSFGFGQWELWGQRTSGDRTTNPTPSFVGQTIKRLFFIKNRLGIVTGDNHVVLSKSGEKYKFYADTVLEVLDTDPIDIQAGENVEGFAVWNNEPLLLGEKRIRCLTSGERAFTPSTVSLAEVVGRGVFGPCVEKLGPDVYFPVSSGNFVGLHRLRSANAKRGAYQTESEPLTDHVPKYIPTGDLHFASALTEELLFVHSSGEPSSLFLLRPYTLADDSTLSAWSKWTFAGDIIAATVEDGVLYLVLDRSGVLCLEKLRLSSDIGRIHLDRAVDLQGTFDGTKTTFTLPYTDDDLTGYRVAGLTVESTSGEDTLIVDGDHSGQAYTVGKSYTMRYRLSRPFMKDWLNRPIINARLQIRKIHLDIVKTGYFRVEVTAPGRSTEAHEISLARTGALVTVDAEGRMSGRVSVTVGANAEGLTVDLVNDNYQPCFLTAGEWEFLAGKERGRRSR